MIRGAGEDRQAASAKRTAAVLRRAVGATAVALALAGQAADAADRTAAMQLVWHVQTPDGRVIDSRDGDEAFNPASVVKVATTLWALERLGPRHRFATRFGIRGTLDVDSGVLDGDLVVRGSGDPDFHVENAFLVGQALNEAGLREVRGALEVDDLFWIGWEGGSEGRGHDPTRRTRTMAERLRAALDPARHDTATRRALQEMMQRRGIGPETAPRVVVHGAVRRTPSAPRADRDLIVHRSNPLQRLLKRFNSYSNNDIERLAATLGEPEKLERFLTERWGLAGDALRLETLSGLHSNRLTPRLVVTLLDDLRTTCQRLGLQVGDVLPVAGCDPGTLEHFARLRDGTVPLVAKTGTLSRTDGGVAVLAGYVGTATGEVAFCVAAPRSGDRLRAARREQQDWLLNLVARLGGPGPAPACAEPPGYSDDAIQLVTVD